jgi:hypothetical protein
VDSLLVGPTFKQHTCPNPTQRLSIRSTRTVNICMEVTHKKGRTDRLTLVWDRNGEFTSKTTVKIPASTSSHRTRAHMKISKNRLGPWTVRILSPRKASLAEATFEVVR